VDNLYFGAQNMMMGETMSDAGRAALEQRGGAAADGLQRYGGEWGLGTILFRYKPYEE
jgi:hypothetical protein